MNREAWGYVGKKITIYAKIIEIKYKNIEYGLKVTGRYGNRTKWL